MPMLQLYEIQGLAWHRRKHHATIEEVLLALYKNHVVGMVNVACTNTIIKFTIYLKTRKRNHFTTHLNPAYGIPIRQNTPIS